MMRTNARSSLPAAATGNDTDSSEEVMRKAPATAAFALLTNPVVFGASHEGRLSIDMADPLCRDLPVYQSSGGADISSHGM